MLLNDDTWFVSGYNGGNLFFSHGVIGCTRGLEGYVLRRQAGLVWRELSTFSPLYKIAYGELH